MKTQTNPREACLEVGAYQQAQPEGIPSLISRVIQPSYTQQWCNWSFPPGKYNSIPTTGPNLTYWNQYGGFNISGERLALIDGSKSSQLSHQRSRANIISGADVWNDLCYHSSLAPPRYPGTSYNGTTEYFINGAGHHWDSYGILDIYREPQYIQEAHLWEIRTVHAWLEDFTVSC